MPARPRPWKLFFLLDEYEFEADFVVAHDVREARRVFNEMYGGGGAGCTVDLVAAIEKPPEWLKVPTWLGPDCAALEELGGVLLPSTHAPQWQFGDRVWGYPFTDVHRYLPRKR